MKVADITSSRAKLIRAYEHFEALKKEIHEFGCDEDAKRGATTYGRDGAWHVVYLNPIPLMPIYTALLAGDCLTNIRAALDHLVWQLVLREEKKPNKSNCFPIFTDFKEFEEQCVKPAHRNREKFPLYGIPFGRDAWTIIERAQPFHRTQPKTHPLAVVDWLVKIDKHHTLLLQNTFTERDLFPPRIRWEPGFQPIDQRFSDLPLSAKQPTEIARFLFAPGLEVNLQSAMHVEGNLPLQPCAGDGKAYVNLLGLHRATSYVQQILDKVAALPGVQETALQSKLARRVPE